MFTFTLCIGVVSGWRPELSVWPLRCCCSETLLTCNPLEAAYTCAFSPNRRAAGIHACTLALTCNLLITSCVTWAVGEMCDAVSHSVSAREMSTAGLWFLSGGLNCHTQYLSLKALTSWRASDAQLHILYCVCIRHFISVSASLVMYWLTNCYWCACQQAVGMRETAVQLCTLCRLGQSRSRCLQMTHLRCLWLDGLSLL